MIGLAELKRHLNIPVDVVADDDELVQTLSAASAHIEGLCGPLEPRTVSGEVHDGSGGERVVLDVFPIISVQSVTVNGAVRDPSTFRLDGGTLRARRGATFDVGSALGWYGEVVVTYTAGRAVLADDLRQAVLELARHMWESQRGATGNPFLTSELDGQSSGAPLSFLMPYRVESLLARHRLPPSVA